MQCFKNIQIIIIEIIVFIFSHLDFQVAFLMLMTLQKLQQMFHLSLTNIDFHHSSKIIQECYVIII